MEELTPEEQALQDAEHIMRVHEKEAWELNKKIDKERKAARDRAAKERKALEAKLEKERKAREAFQAKEAERIRKEIIAERGLDVGQRESEFVIHPLMRAEPND